MTAPAEAMPGRPILSVCGVMLSLAAGDAARAEVVEREQSPLRVEISSTLDTWVAVSGGPERNAALLHRGDLAASFEGKAVGADWLSARVSYFHVKGQGPGKRLVADIHGVDNNEAEPGGALLEAWVDLAPVKGFAVRLGQIDVNAQFDAIETAAVMLNSGHGMGTEFSASGDNGPGAYPATGFGISTEVRRQNWVVRAAALDGSPGLDGHKIHGKSRTLFVGQVGYERDDRFKVGIGGYLYEKVAGSTAVGGMYAIGEWAFGKGWRGWARLGFADRRISHVADQISGGIATEGAIFGRPDDVLALAISTVRLHSDDRTTFDHPSSETNIELTYQMKLSDAVTLQPDLQYVINPAFDPGKSGVVLAGLRLNMSFGM